MFIVIGNVLDNTRACQKEREKEEKYRRVNHDIDRVRRITHHNSCK